MILCQCTVQRKTFLFQQVSFLSSRSSSEVNYVSWSIKRALQERRRAPGKHQEGNESDA